MQVRFWRRAGGGGRRGVGACAAMAALTALLFGTPGAAQDRSRCAQTLSASCVESLGAGALSAPSGDCAAEMAAYRACLSEIVSSAAPQERVDASQEQAAERAYLAVKDSADPEALRLVAARFKGTFWADLAAREAARLDASGPGRRPAAAARPRIAAAPRLAPLDPFAARFLAAQPGEVLKECAACPGMIALKGGAFLMGSPETEAGRYQSEGPPRRVTLRPFAMARDETTFGQWRACVEAGFCRPLDEKTQSEPDTKPALGVSWADVTGVGIANQGFLAWLNSLTPGAAYRLPSEAEWEYAARAGSITAFPWGEDYDKSRANGLAAIRFQTTPAGAYPPNNFGLRDMIGNALELTEDCWNASPDGAPSDGAARRTGRCDLRVLKGGAFVSEPRDMRSASRGGFDKGARGSALGFRVARDLVRSGPER